MLLLLLLLRPALALVVVPLVDQVVVVAPSLVVDQVVVVAPSLVVDQVVYQEVLARMWEWVAASPATRLGLWRPAPLARSHTMVQLTHLVLELVL